MAKTTFTLTHARKSDYRGTASKGARQVMNDFKTLLDGAMLGAYGATAVDVEGQAQGTVTLSGVAGVAATGTVTLAGGAGNPTIVVGGTSVGPVTFVTSDIATATACVTALNANVTVGALITASNVGGTSAVITLTADVKGTAGNAITLTASRSAGTATASGATLAGGLNAVTVTIAGDAVFVATEGVNDAATAALIADEISSAGAGVMATSSANVVTITAEDTGAGGDAITLTSSAGAGTATASGATLTGGAAISYTF